MLSQSEGQVLVDIMNDHGLEQLVNFPTREYTKFNFNLITCAVSRDTPPPHTPTPPPPPR